MGTKERRERERDEVRTKILDAARDLFVHQGYEAVSMRKIADAIEYSPTAIYVHFKDKADLMRQLCQNDFHALADIFKDLLNVKDPIERIRQAGLTYVRFAAQYPNHYRLMFMTPHAEIQGEDALKEQCELDESKHDPETNSYALLHLSVQEAFAQGRFRPELANPDLIAQTFWAAVHGVSAIENTFKGDPWLSLVDVEQRAQVMVDAILRGMVKP